MKSRPEGRRKLLGDRRAAGYDARMEPAVVFTNVFVAVIAGNIITLIWVYALSRIFRNENDWTAIGLILFCTVTVVLGAYAIRWPT